MSHTSTLLKVLLVTLLILLCASRAASVAAGTDAGQSPIFTCDGVSEIPHPECEALVALYNSTNGPGWANQTGWLATNTPCSWYGVMCETGHVMRISLAWNQLNGAIPAELGNLANLRWLNLYSNQLSGAIPAALGNLANLRRLHLNYNQLSGAIPVELGNLANLQELFLFSSQLSGAIPVELGNLANLQDSSPWTPTS